MSASAMEQLYQQVILDHYKSPNGRGLRDAPTAHACGESHQLNPTCGDEVTLRVVVEPSEAGPTIESISWDGQGCSISQASLSVMTELAEGSPVSRAEELGDLFRDLMATRGKGLDDDDAEDRLGDATAFTGVSKFPARIKCALLGWAALRDALVRTGTVGEALATASSSHTTPTTTNSTSEEQS
ncbi:Fe-S cluster assembly sulfur transfer protein SufU [Sanguibacter sp. A247]|uniref:Fe-S cluster assembly sulfur transfer protein SufU n=1 Tax=unclassified Sanguibacter TaxID=2645534 RepID=UPI003FD8D76B